MASFVYETETCPAGRFTFESRARDAGERSNPVGYSLAKRRQESESALISVCPQFLKIDYTTRDQIRSPPWVNFLFTSLMPCAISALIQCYAIIIQSVFVRQFARPTPTAGNKLYHERVNTVTYSTYILEQRGYDFCKAARI